MSRRFLSALAVMVVAAWPATAQDTRVLADQIERLQADLKDLQRYVYAGGQIPDDFGASTGGLAGSDPGQVEVRITELEGQIRELRGLIEESTHRLGNIETRLDQLVADVDTRLAALERSGGASGAAAASVSSRDTASQDMTLIVPEPEQTEPAPGALPSGTIMDQYNYAFGLLRKTDYDGAEQALTAFVGAYPDDPLTGNAYYWLGQVYSVRNDFERAAVTYLKGYRQFPEGKYAPHSLLKLGTTLGQLDKKIEACASFQELAKKFPDAEAAVQSEAASAAASLGCS